MWDMALANYPKIQIYVGVYVKSYYFRRTIFGIVAI
jgi:hypothetical protein